MKENKVKRNHFFTVIYNIINSYFRIFIPMLMLFIFKAEIRVSEHIIKIFIVSIIFLLFSALTNILKWKKTIYYIYEGKIYSKKGIFFIKEKEIQISNIYSVDLEQKFINRMLNIAKIKIDTGNSSENEAEIELFLKLHEAKSIKNKLTGKVCNEELNKKENLKENYYKLDKKSLILYGLTKVKFGIGFVVILTVYNFIDDYLSFILKDELLKINDIVNSSTIRNYSFDTLIKGILLFLILYLIIIILFSVIKSFIKLYDYSISRSDSNINIKYGLFDVKNYSFDIEKISGVFITQTFIQQILNLKTIEVEVVGYGNEKNEVKVLYPLVNENKMNEILSNILYDYYKVNKVNKVQNSTKFRFIRVRFIVGLIIQIILFFVFYKFNLVIYSSVGLLIILYMCLDGYFEYRNSGYYLNDKLIVLQYGGFKKRRAMVLLNKVESAMLNQSVFQKNKKLNDFGIVIQGNSFGKEIKTKNLNEKDGLIIFNKLFSN